MRKRDNDILFVKELTNNIMARTNVSQLCRVVSIADDKKTISAQPMALDSMDNKRSMLINVHVGRMLRDEIIPGDIVLVIFLDRSIENWDQSNRNFKLESKRLHSLNDAFVVEVY